MSRNTLLSPGSTIGIIGEGQLGQMLALKAHEMGYKVHIFGNNKNGCALNVTKNGTVVTSYENEKALDHFIDSCDVVTIETENLPEKMLANAQLSRKLFPRFETIHTAADRLLEKQMAARLKILHARFCPIDKVTKTPPPDFPFPAFLKTRTGGFDGRSQIECKNVQDLENALTDKTLPYHKAPCILEEKLHLKAEVSVAIARNRKGEKVVYPLAKNKHQEGILRKTSFMRGKGTINYEYSYEGSKIATAIAEEIDLVGLLVIEMFLVDGKLYFNEMAPRPHNSYHWTMEGCTISQFEMLIRAITGLPLIKPRMNFEKVEMYNILEAYTEDDLLKWMGRDNCHLHLYGKDPRPHELRKIGHYTVVHH